MSESDDDALAKHVAIAEGVLAEAIRDVIALRARLIAAEALLQQAEAVIEILLGDGHHKHAEIVMAAIDTHWNTYPEPLE